MAIKSQLTPTPRTHHNGRYRGWVDDAAARDAVASGGKITPETANDLRADGASKGVVGEYHGLLLAGAPGAELLGSAVRFTMDVLSRSYLCTPALMACILSSACDSTAPHVGAATQAPAAGPAAAGTSGDDFPGTYQGADALARALMKPGGDLALTQALKPRTEDYALVFEATAADAIREGFEPIWGSMNAVGAMDGQTELRLVSATSDELRKGVEVFPEYGPVLPLLRPGFTWYRFKFVRPGESAGKDYDGLVYVKDHWALFPEPWRHVPAPTKPLESDCKKFADHFASLMTKGQEGPAAEITKQVADGMKDDLVKECVDKGTAKEIACALAADSMDMLEKCGGSRN